MGNPYPPRPDYGPPPPGYASPEEKNWALLTHFGGIIIGFIAPLITLLVKGQQSPTLRAHAVEALNFQIPWNAALLVGQIISVCSGGFLFFIPLGVWLVMAVFCVLGGLRANEGQLYHYPLSARLVS